MTDHRGITRRGLLGGAAILTIAVPTPVPFAPDEFATVGVFGLDWLLDPRFTRMLDILAASPGAVRAVRVFGALSLGRDTVFPTQSAGVWDGPGPPDFSRTLSALEALTSRGFVPFLPLSFFPPAVSPTPTRPPAEWGEWTRLVRAFLNAIMERFGLTEVTRWWFEVWNEPNMPFWAGSFDQYLDFYRVTSEVVVASGYPIRLGGPVIAYLPGNGPVLIKRFLAFLAATPAARCDFISFHRKGSWSSEEGEPDLARVVRAADDTAQAVLRLIPSRARGLVIVDDEADMTVGFDRPYAPRMTSQSAAWLASSMVAHDALNVAYARHGIRFRAASDNANQQLARGPFDGRRTLMTPVSAAPEDLVKLPVFGFYELLRLMGSRRVPGGPVPPEVSHLCTAGKHGMTVLFSRYGGDGCVFDYDLTDVPWRRINIVQFCIDAEHTNAVPKMDVVAMRLAAELAVVSPIQRGVTSTRQQVVLAPFGTILMWISPFLPRPPAAPCWVEVRREGASILLRWEPNTDMDFYSYELLRNGIPIAPDPLRAAFWIDAGPAGQGVLRPYRYAVRAVTASGAQSNWAVWRGTY